MIQFKPKTIKALQSGELKASDFAAQLVALYPASEISLTLVESLLVQPEPIEKIKITEQQFHQLIKVIGVSDVTVQKAERRGRPAKKGE